MMNQSKNLKAMAALGLLFMAGTSLAVFVEPTVPATGGNVLAPLNTGNNAQVKEGLFGANKISTTGKLCFGPTACIGGWWDTAQNSCRLEVKKVNSNGGVQLANGGAGDTTCNYYLTAASKAAGWVAVGSDLCGTMWDRDCQYPSTCIYMRMKCGGSVIVDAPTSSSAPGIEVHPVSGFTQ